MEIFGEKEKLILIDRQLDLMVVNFSLIPHLIHGQEAVLQVHMA